MKLFKTPLLLLVSAAICAAPQPMPAQQAPPAQQQPAPILRQSPALPTAPTLHIESRLVSVALNVTDAQGDPVPGLNASDFQLTEDGLPQKIAIFERESATPLDIILAFDASESVFGDQRLERDAVKSFVRSLVRPQDRVDLMSFADRVSEIVSFTNDPKRIEDGLGRIQRGDATALYDAIYLASQRLGQMPAAGGVRRVLVLITDGENTTEHGTYPMALQEAEHAGAMIYSLIIVPIEADAGRNTGGEHALIQMARDTGGKYYYVNSRHDLGPAFAHVSADLRNQYTLGYYAPQHAPRVWDSSSPPGLRHIHIQLKDPALRAQYTLRYRTAYYANR